MSTRLSIDILNVVLCSLLGVVLVALGGIILSIVSRVIDKLLGAWRSGEAVVTSVHLQRGKPRRTASGLYPPPGGTIEEAHWVIRLKLDNGRYVTARLNDDEHREFCQALACGYGLRCAYIVGRFSGDIDVYDIEGRTCEP